MNLTATAQALEPLIATASLAALYTVVFFGALWGLAAAVGLAARPARQMAPVRVRHSQPLVRRPVSSHWARD